VPGNNYNLALTARQTLAIGFVPILRSPRVVYRGNILFFCLTQDKYSYGLGQYFCDSAQISSHVQVLLEAAAEFIRVVVRMAQSLLPAICPESFSNQPRKGASTPSSLVNGERMDGDPGSLLSVRRIVSMYDVRCTEEHCYARRPSMIPVVAFSVLLSLYVPPEMEMPFFPSAEIFHHCCS